MNIEQMAMESGISVVSKAQPTGIFGGLSSLKAFALAVADAVREQDAQIAESVFSGFALDISEEIRERKGTL